MCLVQRNLIIFCFNWVFLSYELNFIILFKTDSVFRVLCSPKFVSSCFSNFFILHEQCYCPLHVAWDTFLKSAQYSWDFSWYLPIILPSVVLHLLYVSRNLILIISFFVLFPVDQISFWGLSLNYRHNHNQVKDSFPNCFQNSMQID